jgi:membrane protein
VPLVGVALVGLSLLDDASGRDLLGEVFTQLVPEPDRAAVLADGVHQLASNVTVDRLGTWGFLGVIGLAFALFMTLENSFDRVWRVRRSRNVVVRFTMFYTLATLGPLLLVYSFAQPILPGLGRALGAPLVTTTIGMIALNRWMPNAKVGWRAAVVGGAVAALAFELGKIAFGLYLTRVALATYEGIYGSLAIVPVYVVWSYLSWLVVLLGAEIAFAVQQARAIALAGYVNPYIRARHVIDNGTGRTAARLLLAVCDRFERHGAGTTAAGLSERFQLSLDRVGELMNQLERGGFVLQAEASERSDADTEGFVPARSLDRIRVVDVLALFDDEESRRPRRDALTDCYARLDASRTAVVGELTYATLVRERGASG